MISMLCDIICPSCFILPVTFTIVPGVILSKSGVRPDSVAMTLYSPSSVRTVMYAVRVLLTPISTVAILVTSPMISILCNVSILVSMIIRFGLVILIVLSLFIKTPRGGDQCYNAPYHYSQQSPVQGQPYPCPVTDNQPGNVRLAVFPLFRFHSPVICWFVRYYL